MIRINLLTSEKSQEKKKPAISIAPNELTKQLGFVALFLVTAAICAYLYFSLSGYKDELKRDIREATVQRDRLKDIKDLVDRLTAERERLNTRLEVLSDRKNNLRSPVHPITFIFAVHQQFPGLTISDINERIDEESGLITLIISGTASQSSLNSFSKSLMEQPIVQRVDIQSQIQDRFNIRVVFMRLHGFGADTDDGGEAS